jgi:hypothetical protein
MPEKVGVAVIHGVGSQGVRYAEGMIQEINANVDKLYPDGANRIEWQAIHWAYEFEKRETAYLRDATRENDMDWLKLRKFVVSSVGDAVSYRHLSERPDSAYKRIHGIVEGDIAKLRVRVKSDEAPLIVLAHSLGAVIMSDYIWDMKVRKENGDVAGLDTFEQLGTLVGLVTFGCNLPLFSFGTEDPKAIDFPGFAVSPELSQKARWYNYYDPDDLLGFPLKQISDSYDVAVNEDIPIDVGGILTGWNPASHVRYWTDNDFTEPVARFISEFL